MITVYGIKNCDTIKKARTWLEQNQIQYSFHDYRVDGLERKLLESWSEELGWEALVNKRSTTWRNLDDSVKASMDQQTAIDTMLEQPTLIKRPLLDTTTQRILGFKADQYKALFEK